MELLRCEILARQGKSFTGGKLRAHFMAQPWYEERPEYEVQRGVLTTAERTMLERIEALERDR